MGFDDSFPYPNGPLSGNGLWLTAGGGVITVNGNTVRAPTASAGEDDADLTGLVDFNQPFQVEITVKIDNAATDPTHPERVILGPGDAAYQLTIWTGDFSGAANQIEMQFAAHDQSVDTDISDGAEHVILMVMDGSQVQVFIDGSLAITIADTIGVASNKLDLLMTQHTTGRVIQVTRVRAFN